MEVARTIAEVRAARRTLGGSAGLVPTMGYLHEGHLSLVRRARAENDTCMAWIFVNPTQFGPQEDFRRYPRDEARDIALLEQERVDLVFVPSAEEIYPPGFNTYVDVRGVTERLEGAARPGHFLGVATVVTKFFHLMQPDRAYFGQKDAQQLVVIRQLVRDLNFDLEVVACPTVREAVGLAMSSRNVYLSPEERRAATVLYRSLRAAEERWRSGERSGDALRQVVREVLAQEPLTVVEYVSVADPEGLEELHHIDDGALVSLVVRIGQTRLIDNVVLR